MDFGCLCAWLGDLMLLDRSCMLSVHGGCWLLISEFFIRGRAATADLDFFLLPLTRMYIPVQLRASTAAGGGPYTPQ